MKNETIYKHDALNALRDVTAITPSQQYVKFDCIYAIEELPSVQSEIIHCKDCKFWQDQEEGVVEVPICARPQNKFERFPMVMIIGADGFCSFAKRRENE